MDESITRHGQPCWYHIEGVGLKDERCVHFGRRDLPNDSQELPQRTILRRSRRPYARSTQNACVFSFSRPRSNPGLQVSYQTEMGQLVDLITAPEDRVDLSQFKGNHSLFHLTFKNVPTTSMQAQDDCPLQNRHILVLPSCGSCAAPLRLPHREGEGIRSGL